MNMERTGGLAVAILAFESRASVSQFSKATCILLTYTFEIGGVPLVDQKIAGKKLGKLYDSKT